MRIAEKSLGSGEPSYGFDAMMNVPENELFSAYLDGELTAAEQAEVERLLAASPAARQLVDDLRALSSTLQCLPAHKLDEDLSQQVLRLAEHRVLSGRTDSDPFSSESVASASRWQAIARRLSRPRIWVWPGLAVAVGLLLMVLHPEQAQRMARQPAERHVALAPADAPRTLSEPLAIGAAADADRDGRAEKSEIMRSAERMREESSIERPAQAVGHVSNVPLPESAPAETKKEAAKEPSRPTAMPAAPSAPATSPPALSMKAARRDLSLEIRPAKEGPAERAEKAPEEVTIVHCDVTREAIELRIVEQALARRQVVLLGRPAKDGKVRDLAGGAGGADRGRRFSQVELEETSKIAAREAIAAKPVEKRSVDKTKADSGTIVYLRAEATPAQLEAVLVDLRSQPQMVRSLSRESHIAGSGEEDARGGAQAKAVQDMPAMADTVRSDSAANRLQNEQMQRRAPGKPGQEGQQMYRQVRQKAIDATQATGTRAAGPAPKTADRRARQGGQQSDESAPQVPADAGLAPAQQAMPAGQAGVAFGAKAPSAAISQGKSLSDVSADAEAQGDVKRRVVFVLRTVGPNPTAAEEAGAAQTAKPAPAKAAPMRAEAAKSAESSRPAAAAQPAAAAPK